MPLRGPGATIRTLRRTDLPENGVLAFDVGGTHYLVADVDGEIVAFAVAGRVVADLGRTAVADGRVHCPMHGWAIDPRVGRCGAADYCRYEPIPVEVHGEEIRIISALAE